MNDTVKQMLEQSLANERAAHASAVARRQEIATDLSTQDAIVQFHERRIADLEEAAGAPGEPDETQADA